MFFELNSKGNKIAIINLSEDNSRKFSETFSFLKRKLLKEYGIECTSLNSQMSHDFLAYYPQRSSAEIPTDIIINDINKALADDKIKMLILYSENYANVSEYSGTYSRMKTLLSGIDFSSMQISEKPIMMYQENSLNHYIHYKGGATSLIYAKGIDGNFSEFMSPNILTVDSAKKTLCGLLGLNLEIGDNLENEINIYDSEINVFQNIGVLLSYLNKLGMLKLLNDSLLLGQRDELELYSDHVKN